MKSIKRFLSFLLVCTMLASLFSFYSSANRYISYPESGNYYYIQHVGSNKCWDITDGSTNNGARLQIWPKSSNHQNQVFYLQKVGNYWKIIAHHSQKAIEVRDSSKANEAQVAQWDYCNIACQQWSIICNSDGTVSFKNRNSGKYIDVTGNNSANGTKMIQYQYNGSNAQKFRLYCLYNNDILNATWTRTFSNSEIAWTKLNLNSPVTNYTHFSKKGCYPTAGKTYLKKVEYIDADTVHNMLVQKGLNKSTLQQIKELGHSEGKEEAAAYLLKRMGYDVPGVGIAIGIIEILATADSNDEWNKFANTTRSGKGIKKTTYVKIVKLAYYGPLNNGTTAYGIKYCVKENYSYSYSVWDGNGGVKAPKGYSGYWNYTFK